MLFVGGLSRVLAGLQLSGGVAASLASQLAQATGQNLSATLVSSEPLGTMTDELAGAPQFNLDPSMGPPPTNTTTSVPA